MRVTGSGLGCPTWPRCTDESYVVHGALGIHGAIEFGNRMLTFVLVALALALLGGRAGRSGGDRPAGPGHDHRPRHPAQAVIGGVTVLTDLNPWVVALHLLVSMAIIGVCVLLVDELRGPERPAAPVRVRRLTWLVFAAAWVVLYLGTVVTGSGPHSGDLDARRTGLDPQVMSHVHAIAVYFLVALTVGLVVLAHRAGAPLVARAAGAPARRRAGAGAGRLHAVLPRPARGTGRAAPARRRADLRDGDLGAGRGASAQQRVHGDGDEQQREVEVRDVEQPHRVDAGDVLVGSEGPGAGPEPVRLDQEHRAEHDRGRDVHQPVSATGQSSSEVATVAQV